MRQCTVSFEGLSPYSQSAMHDTKKLERESADDFDERTWQEKCTVNAAGQVCVPAMAFKQALDTTAYKLGKKVEGRRGATYKNFFASGFFCDADVPLFNGSKPLTKKDAEQVAIFANADGVRGSGKRVRRRFPQFNKYHGDAIFTITDNIITQEVFEEHVRLCGLIVGIGRFRPEKGGTCGRFKITKIEWGEISL